MSSLKILVAEDEKVTQALYVKGLTEEYGELRIVSDGEQALSVYSEWKPDILLLDFSMPVLNGYQVLKEIRQAREDKQTAITMVTSMSEKEEIVACAQLGIQGYIVKPFKMADIGPKILGLYSGKK